MLVHERLAELLGRRVGAGAFVALDERHLVTLTGQKPGAAYADYAPSENNYTHDQRA